MVAAVKKPQGAKVTIQKPIEVEVAAIRFDLESGSTGDILLLDADGDEIAVVSAADREYLLPDTYTITVDVATGKIENWRVTSSDIECAIQSSDEIEVDSKYK